MPGRSLARGNSPASSKGGWSVDILAMCPKPLLNRDLCSVVFDGVGLYCMGLYRMGLYRMGLYRIDLYRMDLYHMDLHSVRYALLL